MKKLILLLAFVFAMNVADACDEYWTTTDYQSGHCEGGVIVFNTSTQGMNRHEGGGTVWYTECGSPWTGVQPTSMCC